MTKFLIEVVIYDTHWRDILDECRINSKYVIKSKSNKYKAILNFPTEWDGFKDRRIQELVSKAKENYTAIAYISTLKEPQEKVTDYNNQLCQAYPYEEDNQSAMKYVKKRMRIHTLKGDTYEIKDYMLDPKTFTIIEPNGNIQDSINNKSNVGADSDEENGNNASGQHRSRQNRVSQTNRKGVWK